MSQCHICHEQIRPFISFGHQPLANAFREKSDSREEYFYEMQVMFCESCKMVQLAKQPDEKKMFHEEYAFYSGTSKRMGDHFSSLAKEFKDNELNDLSDGLLEIGCNDGILLKNFVLEKYRHLGVEPSANVAYVAREKGVQVVESFFNLDTAQKIKKEHGTFKVLFSANVMNHIIYMDDVIEGMNLLLSDGGILVLEDPYLGDIIEKTAYDQFYDEHIYLYSLTSMAHLYGRHGFQLFDVQPQITHGGSMRYYFCREGDRAVHERVSSWMQKEEDLGLYNPTTYDKFRSRCEKSKIDFVNLLTKLKQEGHSIAGYAATAKSTTVTNYCGITSDLISVMYDSTPIKQGRVNPGTHIPVLSDQNFKKDRPDYTVLFAYNHSAEIFEKEAWYKESGGKWIVYVPEVKILS